MGKYKHIKGMVCSLYSDKLERYDLFGLWNQSNNEPWNVSRCAFDSREDYEGNLHVLTF